MVGNELLLLKEDLKNKFDQLCFVHHDPGYALSQYFVQIRNNIDYDAELLLTELHGNKLGKESESTVEKVKSLRKEYVAALDEIEAKMRTKLPVRSTGFLEAFATLKMRIDQFTKAVEGCGDVNGTEEVYLDLALEMMEKTRLLEKEILANQTVFYYSSKRKNKLGSLVHLKDVFLSLEEIKCIKMDFYIRRNTKETRLDLEKTFNSSFVIASSRPFILDRKILMLVWLGNILSCWAGLTDKLIRIERSENGLHVENNAELERAIVNEYSDMLQRHDLRSLSIDGFDNSANPFEDFAAKKVELRLNGNRFKSLTPQLLSLAGRLVELDLSDNQLESLDEELLSKCANLHRLSLLNACLPDTKFNLGFLTSLSGLKILELTLPDTSTDLEAFEHLTNLTNLHLESPWRSFGDEESPKLTKQAFKHLSKIPQLKELCVYYFNIKTLDQEMLNGFENLRTLSLSNNQIEQIAENAFKKSSRKLEHINLDCNQIAELSANIFAHQTKLCLLNLNSNRIRMLNASFFQGLKNLYLLSLQGNRIDELAPGVFDGLSSLRTVYLGDNNIRRVKSDVFEKMSNPAELECLELSRNPIEAIEGAAFSRVDNLRSLYLDGGRLEFINNQMLRNLPLLYCLSLANNRIKSIDVITEDHGCKSLVKINGIMSPRELDIVKQNLFCDLKSLKILSLKGNLIERIDLNVFINLGSLNELDLSFNMITELNDQIEKGALENLSSLNLANNQLTFVSKEAFSNSRYLSRLDMSNNKLARLDPDFFAPFETLSILSLQNNNLSIVIQHETLPKSLREINLLENKMTRVEEGALEGLRSLEELRVDLMTTIVGLPQRDETSRHEACNCIKSEFRVIHLNKSDPDTLRSLLSHERNRPSLKKAWVKLIMTDSSLQSLEGFDFEQSLSNLTELDLSKNQLKTLNASWFDNLPQLKGLNFSQNMIETLEDPDLFKRIVNLRKINLSANRLSSFSRRLFQSLAELEALDLSNNSLTFVDHGIFRGLLRLQDLNLSSNKIAYLNVPKLFEWCSSLETLQLSGNPLEQRTFQDADPVQNINLRRFFSDKKLPDNYHTTFSFKNGRKISQARLKRITDTD